MSLGEKIGNCMDDAAFKKKARTGLHVFLGLVVVADIFVPHDHKIFVWDSIPAWWSLYGALSTYLMIVVSKAIGHAWLMKSEDYYD